MKNTLDHLPEDKQEELNDLVSTIKKLVRAEMIILFGSYARGDWVEDRYKEGGTTYEYKSDFDILIVLDTEGRAAGKGVGKKWRRKIRQNMNGGTPVSAIFHGFDYLNKEIEEGSYFFLDILKEGVLLYDSGNFQLSEPRQLSAKERRNKAEKYYKQWYTDANDFYFQFENAYKNKKFKIAAFELHQSAERFYQCTLLVYTDYKPKIHDLEVLDKTARQQDDRFQSIFPRSTQEEDRLFKILQKAYIDSRYKLDYKVDPEDLEKLSLSVRKLKEITEISCKEKIEGLV